MPKRVDHEVRRKQIAEALVRIAGQRGLHAVGMRDVAAEAGISLRLVQYYFQTKEKLLQIGLDPRTLSGDALVKFMRDERDKWGKVIRAANLKVE